MTGSELDRSVRAELAALRPETATAVARHLVMVARLLDDDPESAWRHAAAAREKAARLASVREAVGLAGYASGRYAEALAELRTVRRLTGSNVHLPVMADCERGRGRPERALELAASDEARKLDFEGQVEMLIVAAGARADMGQRDAAVVTLQVPELQSRQRATWLARLRSAYADALAAVGRTQEAQDWLQRALEADVDGEAGIADRLAEDEGLLFEDLGDDLDDRDEPFDESRHENPDGDDAPATTAEAHEIIPDDLDEAVGQGTSDGEEPAAEAAPQTLPTGLFLEPQPSTEDGDPAAGAREDRP